MQEYLLKYGLSLVESLDKGFKRRKKHVKPKSIHNLRLNVKRLRALIDLLSNLDEQLKPLKLYTIKKVYKSAGRLRDLQIQYSIATKIKTKDIDERIAFMNWLREEELKEYKRFLSILNKMNSKSLSTIKTYFKKQKSRVAITQRRYSEYMDNKKDNIYNLTQVTQVDEVYHEIRKELKTLLYAKQLIANSGVIPSPSFEQIERLNTLQEKLGQWNDWFNLHCTLNEVNRKKILFPNLEWLVSIEKEKLKKSVSNYLLKFNVH